MNPSPQIPELRPGVWVESDVQRESARAVEMVHVHLVSSLIDPYSWKWVVLSLHHAVHAFLSASLEVERHAENEEAWNESGQSALDEMPWIEAAPSAETPGAWEHNSLTTLYGRAKISLDLLPSAATDHDLTRLAAARAILLDEVPARWRISLVELPRVVRSGMGLIEYLGWSPGRIPWRREAMLQLARTRHHASMRILATAGAQAPR